MTTAIRLYRTYILSTFVPLNTIRRVFRLLCFIVAQLWRAERRALFKTVLRTVLIVRVPSKRTSPRRCPIGVIYTKYKKSSKPGYSLLL